MSPDSPDETPGQVNAGQTPFTSTPPDQNLKENMPEPSEQPDANTIAEVQDQKPAMNFTNTAGTPNGVLSEADAGVRPLEHPAAPANAAPANPASSATPLGEVARQGGVDHQVNPSDPREYVATDVPPQAPQPADPAVEAEKIYQNVASTLEHVEQRLTEDTSEELVKVHEFLKKAEQYAGEHLQKFKQ